MLSRDGLQWAAPEEPALELLERMRNANVEEMAVVTGGNLVGLVTRDSILRVVQARMDLGHSGRSQFNISTQSFDLKSCTILISNHSQGASRRACAFRGADRAAVRR